MMKQKNTHLHELLRGSSAALFVKICGLTTGYIFTLIITRELGAAALGIFSLSMAILLIVSVVGKLGFNSALLRFVAEYASRNRFDLVRHVYYKSAKVAVPLSIFLSIAFYVSSPFIAERIFHKGNLTSYFQLTSLAVLPAVFISIHSECLRGLKKISEYSLFTDLAVPLCASIILGTIIIFSRETSFPLIAYIISMYLVFIISLLRWLKNCRSSPVTSKANIPFKTIFHISLPMLSSSLLLLVMGWADTIMLGMFRTEADIGIYNAALKLALLTSISLGAVNTIAAPKFAELYAKDDREGLGTTIKQSTRLIFWSSFPFLMLFIFLPSYALGIFGPEFKAGVLALQLLAIGQFINSISGSVGYILQMTGKQKTFHKILLLAAIINVSLNALLIPKFGLAGAAFSSMVSMCFWNICAALYIKVHLNVLTLYFPMCKHVINTGQE